MIEMNEAKMAGKEPPIAVSLKYLGESLDALKIRAINLREKLEPSLTPSCPTPTQGPTGKIERESKSQLAISIDACNEQVQNILEIVTEILKRSEI